MKSSVSQQVRVGLFVFFGLILSISVIFLLGDGLALFERQYDLYGRFKDISGLRIGAPVYLAGIQVGMVKDISFPKELNESQVIVELELKRKFQDRIRRDSEATITTQGLLGDKAIFITVGKEGTEELKNGDEIKVKESLSLDSFAEKGRELIENVNEFSIKANQLIGDVKDKPGLLHALIYDEKGAQLISDISDVAQSASQIVRQVRRGRGMLHALIYDPVDRNIGREFSAAASNFKSLSQDLQEVGSKINRGEGSIGGLVNDPTVYYDLMTLLGKANRNKLLRAVIRATLATNEKDLNK